ncbi:hypothetical protein VTH82DRAFT_4101 [Thermothelomyces myriococcoides]
MAKKGNLATHPIAGGLDSEDMACGRDGQEPVAFTCPAPAGAKLTFEFRMWADASQPGSIDPSHLGVMAIYLKKVSDMKSDAAAGPGWFKIWDQGYDMAAEKWATENLIDNNGLLSVNLPSGLPTGYYLARHEIITLQNVTNDKTDAQFYVGCAQLYVEGTSGATIPSDKTVSIPGHIGDPADPGLTFNVYSDDPSTYKLPGPEVYFPTSTTTTATTTTSSGSIDDNEEADGLVPDDCPVKNANWCATALPSFTDETGCWAASEDCYKQLDACYNSAPPSGSKGCKVWEEQVCAVLVQQCESGNFRGPPKLGEDLGEEVNEPIPGGKLPPAINAGESGNNGSSSSSSGGGSDDGNDEEEAGDGEASPSIYVALDVRTPRSNLKKARRHGSRWR